MNERQKDSKNQNQTNSGRFSRRDILKGLATVPVLGAMAYGVYRKNKFDNILRTTINEELDLSHAAPEITELTAGGKQIRLGLIGFGIRGPHLARGAGFAHPQYIDDLKEKALKDKNDKRYKNFLQQENLNVVINGVCDIFDVYAENAQKAASNINREGTVGKMGTEPRRYRTYKELLAADDIDAVIISVPDHWHGRMTIDAANAGKHVYCEKPMTWTATETYEVVEAVKRNNIVFQLGHQGRQTESYFKAREAIEKNILGKISLIEVTTNRNTPNGAWVYKIHPDANTQTIDWDQFIGHAPYHKFSLERFFRWRCWWDYSTGLSGDLLTHEYDAINQIMDIGIPDSAISSGGIYHFKDGRTVPDVLQTVFEFPEKDMSLVYSASLASSRKRGRVIMGHDASMELGNTLTITADRNSTRYKEKIEKGIFDPSSPLYTYVPGVEKVDAISSPTEKYFAGRGLLYTQRGGKMVDTTHLHIKEWIDCIRKGTQPSCNIDRGFEGAITSHMGTIAYRENRKVYWDKEKKRIV